jgi:hypothetical protein
MDLYLIMAQRPKTNKLILALASAIYYLNWAHSLIIVYSTAYAYHTVLESLSGFWFGLLLTTLAAHTSKMI